MIYDYYLVFVLFYSYCYQYFYLYYYVFIIGLLYVLTALYRP